MHECSVGDVLAHPLIAANGSILLRANVPLTSYAIKRATVMGFKGVYIFDDLSEDILVNSTLPLDVQVRVMQGLNEIDAAIADKQADSSPEAQFDLQTLQQARELLDRRVQDLRTAEMVAMQSVPLIKTMEFSNFNLVQKIDSAFIITLPVFKQAIAQAVLLKRQKIQADAMSALDARTNELLKKNAQNVANTSTQIMQMTANSSIKVETLQETFNTIVNGINDTKRIQEEAQKKRREDQAKLEQMKVEFNKVYNMEGAVAKYGQNS